MTETVNPTRDRHLGDLKLRRLCAGESLGDEAAAAHAAACPQCRARLKELDDEQRRFEQAVPFDRFAAGVEREARRAGARPVAPARRWAFATLPLAAAAALALVIGGRNAGDGRGSLAGGNRIKGGAEIVVAIGRGGGEAGGQRIASGDGPEALAPGERIRIGYKAGDRRYLCAVSLDDQGQATALYPEAGPCLGVDRAGKTQFLPDSVAFTGAGAEQLIVVLSDSPLDMDAVKRAAAVAYRRAGGDLRHLPDLDLGVTQFHRMFLKP